MLKEEAGKCCRGGEENFSDELLRVKVKFGELDRGGSQESLAYSSAYGAEAGAGMAYLGFGTPEEVVPKRRNV